MATAPFAARRPEALLALLLAGCLVLLSLQVRRPNGRTVGETWLLDAATPFVWTVAEVRSLGVELAAWGTSRTALVREKRALSARVLGLESELLRLRDAERDRTRLLELFGAHPRPPDGTQPARLVALETAGPFRTALLDRGTADGIRTGGVVVATRGLLGRVVAAGTRTARVQLLSDRTAAAGVVIVRSSRAAVARGDGTGGVTVLYVPLIADVAAGDILVTSGTDGVYPKDLPLGRVAEVRRSHSLFWELPVTPAADPNLESTVFVLPPVLPPETAAPGGRAEKGP